METPTPSAICRAMSSIETPEAQQDETIMRAKRILRGLGFCGHYMHFHGGGRSGQIPIPVSYTHLDVYKRQLVLHDGVDLVALDLELD